MHRTRSSWRTWRVIIHKVRIYKVRHNVNHQEVILLKKMRQVWVGLCCRGTHLFAVATVSRYQTGSMLFRYTNPLEVQILTTSLLYDNADAEKHVFFSRTLIGRWGMHVQLCFGCFLLWQRTTKIFIYIFCFKFIADM